MTTLRQLVTTWRGEVGSLLAQHPRLYLPTARLKRRVRREIDWLTANPASPRSDIVIEGYPRSGNTFATIAFITAQPAPLDVAHHIHAPAQILEGVRNGTPTILLLRNPADAVASTVLRFGVPLRFALRRYLRFYRPLLRCRDAVVVAPFEEVTSDFGRTVRRVNELFGSDFVAFEHSDESVARVFETIEERNRRKYGKGAIDERSVARPSHARTRLKSDLLTELEGPALRDLLAACDEVYRRFRH